MPHHLSLIYRKTRFLVDVLILGYLTGSKVIKDGDEVEVDADKGVVRIIKDTGK